FRNMGGAVARTDTAIETGIEAAGDAALPREEGVADAGKRKSLGLDHHRYVSKAGSSPSFGSAMASALNNSPMPWGPVAVSRASAWSISAALSGACALSAAARSLMPSPRS